MLFGLLAVTMFSLMPIQHAHAQYAVHVVGDTSGPSVFQQIKESSLDGAAKAAARMIIQQMVSDTINWINSGFQGSPAFVENLDRYLLGIADQVAVDFLESQGFGFLCEPFQLDVRVAVATQYNNSGRNPGEFTPQCTLEDVGDNIEGFLDGSFSQGGWGSWLELTQGSTNDPNKAMFEAQLALDAAIRDAEGNAITELDWGKGFLSFKVCADTEVASGAQRDCNIVTPGQTIADQLNSALNVGRDELITADEINEIIGALLSQLARQALQGGIGALTGGGGSGGTSGGGRYTTDDGTSYDSYLGALTDPNNNSNSYSGPGGSDSLNPYDFANVISSYQQYSTILERIINRLEAARTEYDRVAASCQTTMSLDYPTSFVTRQLDTEGELAEARIRLAAIREIQSRYQDAVRANNDTERTRILEEFQRSMQTGDTISNYEVTQLELYLNYDLSTQLNNFNDDLRAQELRCNPPRSSSDR